MDNIVKARLLIELLDDRKYLILSSFNSFELELINNVPLETLNTITNNEINTLLNDFLTTLNNKKIEPTLDDSSTKEKKDVPPTPIKEKPKETKTEKPKETETSDPTIDKEEDQDLTEKIQAQPPQLIARLINHISEDKKEDLMTKLSDEQKNIINSIEVEDAPISPKVIEVLTKEFNLA